MGGRVGVQSVRTWKSDSEREAFVVKDVTEAIGNFLETRPWLPVISSNH
jgi:hypothetical protein